ncbi:unnamed protein product [Prunus brigantina]
MTSEAPESTSPITITEIEHAVRISASDPITTDRTAESVQEQAVMEDLMDKQAYRIETSFMAAMDRFSSELRTLFQERIPVTSSATPPGGEQRSQERERIEPYGESSNLGASGRTQVSGYGQHSQPPINSWGQSQPTWQIGPVHTLAVQTHPRPSNAVVASSQQYGQCNPTVSPLQASLFPLDSHLHYGSAIPAAAHTPLGQTHGAYLVPPGSVATAEPPVQVAQQIRPMNEGQQVPRPVRPSKKHPIGGSDSKTSGE